MTKTKGCISCGLYFVPLENCGEPMALSRCMDCVQDVNARIERSWRERGECCRCGRTLFIGDDLVTSVCGECLDEAS